MWMYTSSMTLIKYIVAWYQSENQFNKLFRAYPIITWGVWCMVNILFLRANDCLLKTFTVKLTDAWGIKIYCLLNWCLRLREKNLLLAQTRIRSILFCQLMDRAYNSLQLRHNERDDVSNHQPPIVYSKKTSKLRVTCLCEGNSPVTGEFPAQRPVT